MIWSISYVWYRLYHKAVKHSFVMNGAIDTIELLHTVSCIRYIPSDMSHMFWDIYQLKWHYFKRRRHFWKLDGQKMQLWYDMTHQKTHKTINLVNVLQIAMKDTRGVNHLEIRTNSSENSEGKDSVIYYVADDTSGWRLPREDFFTWFAYAKRQICECCSAW